MITESSGFPVRNTSDLIISISALKFSVEHAGGWYIVPTSRFHFVMNSETYSISPFDPDAVSVVLGAKSILT